MRRRILSLLCVLALCLALFLPTQAAGNICFTAVNDRILPLTAETMPTWSGGTLYVPYSVFDVNTTGVSVGTSSTYSRSAGNVSVFNLQHMMVFDLNEGTCRNQHTNEIISARAIIRNGTAYVPVHQVCEFFGLNYSYLNTSYGYLLRITNYDKNSNRTLSDSVFVDAGSNIMKNRLRDYNQSLLQTQEPDPEQDPASTPVQPDPPPAEPEPSAIPTYLAVRCDTGQAAQAIAEALEKNDQVGLFFFPAQEIGDNGALIRRLTGFGHSIGILAEGAAPAETQELLELGQQSLSTVAHSRTYFALVPDKHRPELTDAGWVFWSDAAEAIPTDADTSYAYAQQVVKNLPKKDVAKLTLNDSQASAEHISALLRQLDSRNYVITIPRETKL